MGIWCGPVGDHDIRYVGKDFCQCFREVFFFVFAAAFPFYHLTNREVIASVKAGERMAQPDHCPHEVLGTPAHMISFMFS